MTELISQTQFVNLYSQQAPFVFETGGSLDLVTVAYQYYGKLNEAKDNVILVNHALTGNAHAAGIINEDEVTNSKNVEHLLQYNQMYKGKEGWWSPLIGKGRALDTDKFFIICPNVLGSCYGTFGPTSLIADSKELDRLNFPKVTVRDMIKVQKKLLDYLGVKKIKLAIGGSLGGMQVLEWAIMYGEMIEKIMPIATSAAHSPWAIGLNEAARNAIKNDPVWQNGNYTEQPKQGLSLARKIAMLTYRTYSSFVQKFGREISKKNNTFEVENYLNYQGQKLINRFDANTYLYLSEAMDKHDVGFRRGGIEKALALITCQTKCVGIDSDILYPVEEQKRIASMIPNSTYDEIKSLHGHDAFLIEFEQLDKIIRSFL